MQDLYDFILEVKSMDLYAASRRDCCGENTLIEGNCECYEEENEVPYDEQCMFGKCLSWNEWTDVLTWVNGEISTGAEKVAFDMVPSLFAALAY